MITLVLAFHNHQPVGNFGWVIEDAYQRAYRPLMKVLQAYPEIKFAQHYTGILFDWFAKEHPDFIAEIRNAIHTGRIELLSGGYYEPILAMLPERDRQAQITQLNAKIGREFGTAPQGLWLAERVWEPSLPTTLHAADIAYTFLDDTHFKHAGLAESALTGYFLTEDQGNPLAVFPIDKRLRYTMPFAAPQETFQYLHELNRDGENRVVVFADDGEKFGVWPDTYTSVYEKGWLEQFCSLLRENASWVTTALPSDVLSSRPPAGRIYLPTASYAEMLHWALPTVRAYTEYDQFEHALQHMKMLDHFGQFVRGGFWRNFMVKYPEVNAMQKKTMRVSNRLAAAREKYRTTGRRGEHLNKATQHLLAGECNCPYWHGVFGGLYLSNIRAAIYRELISAERELDAAEKVRSVSIVEEDYDLDGYAEVLFESPTLNFYLSPARGGSVFELDYKPVAYNFCDLLQRRPEGYHAQLDEAATSEESASDSGESKSIHDIVRTKEEGLRGKLVYETYRHALFIDHFFDGAMSAELLAAGKIPETGDFYQGAYACTSHAHSGNNGHVALQRSGVVNGMPVRIEKQISCDSVRAEIEVQYVIRSLGPHPLSGNFGCELAYSLSAGNEPDRYYLFDGRRAAELDGKLSGMGECTARTIELVDEWLNVIIEVTFDEETTVHRAPVETISLSEGGFERNYQGSLLLPEWRLDGMEWRVTFRQRVRPFRKAARTH